MQDTWEKKISPRTKGGAFRPRCCVGLCRLCRGRCNEAEPLEVLTRHTGTLRARLISHRWTHATSRTGHADVRVGGTRAKRACLQSIIPITTVCCVSMSISKKRMRNTLKNLQLHTHTHTHTHYISCFHSTSHQQSSCLFLILTN